MSLQKHLEFLENQKREELQKLERSYRRAKHSVKRTISPANLVRRYPYATLSAAGFLGMLLAPGPARAHAPAHNGESHPPGDASNAAAPTRGPLQAIIADLAGHLDYKRLLLAWIESVSGGGQPTDPATVQPPDATIAISHDGTVTTDQFPTNFAEPAANL